MRQRCLAGQVLQLRHFGCQVEAALCQRVLGIKAPEIQLVDDRQHKNLETHHMHLRPLRHDAQVRAVGAGADEGALELEDAQEIHKIGPDEAQTAQVVQVLLRKTQLAQVVQLGVHFVQQVGQRVVRRVAADKFVVRLCLRMSVQHGLPHGEFVEVGVEQAGDDGRHEK